MNDTLTLKEFAGIISRFATEHPDILVRISETDSSIHAIEVTNVSLRRDIVESVVQVNKHVERIPGPWYLFIHGN